MHRACRLQRPVALCGVASLISDAFGAAEVEPPLETHPKMIDMILEKRPSNNYVDDFEEVVTSKDSGGAAAGFADLKTGTILQDAAEYSQLVCKPPRCCLCKAPRRCRPHTSKTKRQRCRTLDLRCTHRAHSRPRM